MYSLLVKEAEIPSFWGGPQLVFLWKVPWESKTCSETHLTQKSVTFFATLQTPQGEKKMLNPIKAHFFLWFDKKEWSRVVNNYKSNSDFRGKCFNKVIILVFGAMKIHWIAIRRIAVILKIWSVKLMIHRTIFFTGFTLYQIHDLSNILTI